VNRVREIFGAPRVLLPVVHPVGRSEALDSIALAVEVGAPGIFLINQGMGTDDVLALMKEVKGLHPSLWIGVNLLGHSPADALARGLDSADGGLDGIWSDNAGIDEDAESQPEAQAFVEARKGRAWNGLYFGGVAFKYQREVAAEKLSQAAARAAAFMDVVCTSGPGTGLEADSAKLAAMRRGLGPDRAMALASGVTEQNVERFLPYADAYLVGTGIERSFGVFDRAKLFGLYSRIASWRES